MPLPGPRPSLKNWPFPPPSLKNWPFPTPSLKLALPSPSLKNWPFPPPFPQNWPFAPLPPAKTKKTGYTFPYLFDESQSVAKAYKAACTPEFYVFDSELGLTYHGQFDDARPNSNRLVTGVCVCRGGGVEWAGMGWGLVFGVRGAC